MILFDSQAVFLLEYRPIPHITYSMAPVPLLLPLCCYLRCVSFSPDLFAAAREKGSLRK